MSSTSENAANMPPDIVNWFSANILCLQHKYSTVATIHVSIVYHETL